MNAVGRLLRGRRSAARNRHSRPRVVAWPWRRVVAGDLLPFLLGAVSTLAYSPFKLFPLNLLALAALFELWDRAETPREAAWRGWVFGVGGFGTGIYWIFISVHDMGHGPTWLGVGATLLLVAYCALYPALVGYVVTRWTPPMRLLRGLLVLPAAWVLGELLRAWLFTGFPWLSLGYAWVGTGLRSVGPILGVFGISWVVALFAGLAWMLFRGGSIPRLVSAVLIIVLAGIIWVLPKPLTWTHDAGPSMEVTLIQGDVPQNEKWQPQYFQPTLQRYVKLTQDSTNSRLIIWPEAAIPGLYGELKGVFFDPLGQMLAKQHQTLLTGVLIHDKQNGDYYNSAVALGADHGRYDKRHLVPFGEYYPLPGFIRSLLGDVVQLPYSDLSSGTAHEAPLTLAGQKAGVLICYEDAFSRDALTEMPQATLLINISNDAWFGRSIGPWQHLQMARMRALETGRPLLRDTNTGVTAVVGPQGSLDALAPQFRVERLTDTIVPRAGSTPFVAMGGDWPLWLASAFCVVIGIAVWFFEERGRRRTN